MSIAGSMSGGDAFGLTVPTYALPEPTAFWTAGVGRAARAACGTTQQAAPSSATRVDRIFGRYVTSPTARCQADSLPYAPGLHGSLLALHARRADSWARRSPYRPCDG